LRRSSPLKYPFSQLLYPFKLIFDHHNDIFKRFFPLETYNCLNTTLHGSNPPPLTHTSLEIHLLIICWCDWLQGSL